MADTRVDIYVEGLTRSVRPYLPGEAELAQLLGCGYQSALYTWFVYTCAIDRQTGFWTSSTEFELIQAYVAAKDAAAGEAMKLARHTGAARLWAMASEGLVRL